MAAQHRRTLEHETKAERGFTSLLADAVRLTWRADRRGFSVAAGLQVFGSLAPTGLVLVGQYLVNDLVRTGSSRPSLASVLPPVIALAVVSSLVTAATALQQQQQRLLAERVSAHTWEQVLDISSRVRLELYESPTFYDQLQRIKNNAISQPVTVTTSLFGLLGSVVGVAGLLIVVLTIAPLLVPIMLVAGLPSLILARRGSKIEFAFLVRATPIYRARQYLRTILSGRDEAKEIRVFGADGALRRRLAGRQQQYDTLLRAHTRRRIAYALGSVGLSSIFLALTLGVVVYQLTSGRIPFGAAAAAILAVRFLASGLDQLFRSIGGLFEASAYLADLDSFVNRPQPARPAGPQVPVLGCSIELRGVGFSYPAAGRHVLDDVHLQIAAGEVVALVGENGSGKTTLAKLIAGLYAPTAGTIHWDHHNYADVNPSEIHRHVAAIFQDFVRYQLSALDNIGLGEPDRAEDEVAAREAARRANALPYLESLPSGLHTVLSREYEGGSDLSGGQWQRVALARALRKPVSLIILDEPSASLDPRAEADLFADIRTMLQGRSALLISHRFSSVRLADRIYVLQDGHIIEHGDHVALMQAGGLYAELYQLQASAYL